MRRFGIFLLAIAFGITLAAVAAGQETAEKAVYRGRLFTGSGPTTQGVVNVRITIDHLSTAEELTELMKHLAAGDSNGFFDKAETIKVGTLQYLGATGLGIDLNLAFEKKTEKGKQIFLVTEDQPADPTSGWPRSGSEAVGFRHVYGAGLYLVVALDLNEKNQGEGRIYQKARVKFSTGGEFELVSYSSTPLLIVNLRLQ
ncbi:MAG: hypothetical protein NTV82_16400 [Candidatus Aminicenantes bacterium]|nr:hypothetical protein [Candidatus Aminicenantes bacterium]